MDQFTKPARKASDIIVPILCRPSRGWRFIIVAVPTAGAVGYGYFVGFANWLDDKNVLHFRRNIIHYERLYRGKEHKGGGIVIRTWRYQTYIIISNFRDASLENSTRDCFQSDDFSLEASKEIFSVLAYQVGTSRLLLELSIQSTAT